MSKSPTLLEVQGLKKHFPIRAGVFRRVVGQVKAVDNVSFTLRQGETLGLVGESGCGKTTTARTILRLLEPTAGRVLYHGDDGVVDLAELSKRQMRSVRKDMQVVFQDPNSSLDPRMSVGDIVSEPLRVYGLGNRKERDAKAAELLEAVGLNADLMRRYPHEFSGGQRQRIAVARALALSPRLIVCDEPVSALDVSVQAQVINLLEQLQQELGLTYLFVAHDLSVIDHVSDRVAVMYLGQIVELADRDALFQSPRHPYTEALLSAIPTPDPDAEEDEIVLEGDVPSPADPPSGCYFHPRCPYAQVKCQVEAPEFREYEPGHFAACHFAEDLDLRGVVKASSGALSDQAAVNP